MSAAGLFAFAAPAEATTYYFSNCAVGGSGTQASPFCLDPAGVGRKVSFQYLMDGAAPDVVAGDTIALCAGACDGTGSATYGLDSSGTTNQNNYTYVFAPRVSGTASSPITITAYNGEAVVLSGDTNQNGVPDTGEPQVMLTDVTSTAANKAWYVIKNLTFEKVTSVMFYLNNNPANWTFDNVEARYMNGLMWNGGNIGDTACGNDNINAYVFKLADLQGPLIIRNSRFHHICGAVHRHTVNQSLSASVLSENNEYYNVSVVTNNFQGRNETWRGNYMHDFIDGLTIEEDMKDIVIEDNIVACPGDYKAYSDGRCARAIHISDGDNGAASAGKTKNITIRRNKVWGRIDGQFGGSQWGYFLCGIRVTATNNTEPLNIVIENNMVWHHLSWSSDDVCAAGIGVDTNRSEVTIQNNTVYDSSNGIALDATVPGIAYTVRNNLLIRANKGGNRPEMVIAANAAGSTLRNNNMHSDGQGDPVMNVAGTNYSCSQIATYQSGNNKCSATTFTRVTGTVKDWDLHLPATDTANRNAGIAGPTDDIDKTPRGTAPIDLGADEFGGPAGVTATLAVQSSGQAAPQNAGTWMLKAGTYTLTLTTSAAVVSVPGPLTLTANGGGTTQWTLSGSTPGTQFTGSMTVGTGIAEGNAGFSLPTGSLDDGQGNRGQQITTGSAAVIDRTPPGSPTGVRTQ